MEHYEKRIEILHGCPFEGWPNRAQPSHPFWQKSANWLNWPCSVRSALKRKPVQDFNSFSIMLYYIIIAPHIKKLESYFALFIFLDFHTVCNFILVSFKSFELGKYIVSPKIMPKKRKYNTQTDLIKRFFSFWNFLKQSIKRFGYLS